MDHESTISVTTTRYPSTKRIPHYYCISPWWTARSSCTAGAGGVSQDTLLAEAYAALRTLRLADGPDEVHMRTIARWELIKSWL